MGVTTVSPILTTDIALPLQALQLVNPSRYLTPPIYHSLKNRWTVAGTTIWSGLSYLVGRGGFRVVKPPTKGI